MLEATDMIIPLTAYFDASGCEPDREVFSVGGWIAEVDQWKQFCRAWQPILDRAPFAESIAAEDRIFHAADLESLKGIYCGWTKEQQQAFQGEAYQIIQDLQLFPIATAVVKSDYEKLQVRFSQFKQGHEGNYYLHSLHDVLKNVHNWLEAQPFETSVEYISGDHR